MELPSPGNYVLLLLWDFNESDYTHPEEDGLVMFGNGQVISSRTL